MDDVTATLLDGGIEQFEQAMATLIAGVEARREAVVTGRPAAIEASIPPALEPAIAARVARAVNENVAARIWRHDETLWGGPGPEIGNRLGWLTISETMLEHADELRDLR